MNGQDESRVERQGSASEVRIDLCMHSLHEADGFVAGNLSDVSIKARRACPADRQLDDDLLQSIVLVFELAHGPDVDVCIALHRCLTVTCEARIEPLPSSEVLRQPSRIGLFRRVLRTALQPLGIVQFQPFQYRKAIS